MSSSTLTDANIRQLPGPIVEKLEAIISRVRRLQWFRGILAILALTLPALLIVMAVDATFTVFSNVIRWGLTLAVLAVAAGAAWWYLVRPLSRPLTLTHIARVLELRHPELQERISSAVELLSSRDSDDLRGSEQLIDELVRTATLDVQDVVPEREFSGRKLQRFVISAAAAGLVIALLLIIWPTQTSTLITRAVAPFLNVGNAFANHLIVDPGNFRVPLGDSLTIEMMVRNQGLKRAELHRADLGSDEAPSIERMTLTEASDQDGGKRRFALTFPHVQESFRYRIRAGSALSEYFEVTAVPRPAISSLTATLHYPEYTGLEPSEVFVDDHGVAALAGSRVDLSAKLSKPITSATASLNSAALNGGIAAADTAELPTEARWEFSLTQEVSGTVQIGLTDEHGISSEPITVEVLAVPDRAPTIKLTSPKERNLVLKPEEFLPIRFSAMDDFGISAVDILYEIPGTVTQERSQPLPSPAPGGGWNGLATLDLGSLILDNTEQVVARVRVRDNLPPEMGGPQQALSEPITIELTKKAKSFTQQAIDNQQKAISDALREARKELDRARNELKQAKDRMQKEKELSVDARRDLDEFRKQAASAQERMEQISREMQQTAFDKQADKLEETASQSLRESREAADMIPLSDDEAQQLAQAEAAREQLEEAMKQLEDIQKQIPEAAKEAQAAVKISELATKQQQLANEAAKQANQQSADAKQEAKNLANWKREQQQIQKTLGEMLQENPDAIKNVLDEQRQQARELAEAAQALAAEQEALREMTQEAAQDPDREKLQDSLLTSLSKMQEAIARDAEELRQQLEQARQDAMEAGENADSSPKEMAQAEARKEENNTSAEASSPTKEETGSEPAPTSNPAAESSLASAAGEAKKAAESLKKEQLREAMQAAKQAQEAFQQMQAAAGDKPANEQKEASPAEPNPMSQEKGDSPANPDGAPAAPQDSPASADGQKQMTQAEITAQSAAASGEKGEPQEGENQASSPKTPQPGDQPAPAQASASSPAAGQQPADAKNPGEPGNEGKEMPGEGTPSAQSSPLARAARELSDRQEAVARQLEAIQGGELEKALSELEASLSEKGTQLSQRSENLNDATRMAQQNQARTEAYKAQSLLNEGSKQADRAKQLMTDAGKRQSQAEQKQQTPQGQTSQDGQQRLAEAGSKQNEAHQDFRSAAEALQQAAQTLEDKGAMIPPTDNENNPMAQEGQNMAQSFQQMSQASQAGNAQEASAPAQQAASTLRQLALLTMQKLGGGADQNQKPGENGDPTQNPDTPPGDMTGENPGLNPGDALRRPDWDGTGIPPDFEDFSLITNDWVKLQGALQSGSGAEGAGTVPEEYRELVNRYFRVMASQSMSQDN